MYKIKELRKERGLSQTKLAAMLGVTRAVISQYEVGTRKPKTEQLKKIAAALNCSYWDLVGEDEIFKQWIDSLFSKMVTEGIIVSYEWDGEDRLLVVQKLPKAITMEADPDFPDTIPFSYDNEGLSFSTSMFSDLYQKQVSEAYDFLKSKCNIQDDPE